MESLLVITTGGTIDKVYFDALSEFQVGEPVVAKILNNMNVAFDFECIEICRKDSLELTDGDRNTLKDIIHRTQHKKILITHGTDTMVKSAQTIGEQEDKTIVFTGAMQPAAFTETDAVFNIGTAIGALMSQGMTAGSYIAMSGQVYPASHVEKNYQNKRFEGK
ncbi:asparaginase domain-containing protein [Oceaniserpentilla sp. 4NH20-0058]|uniref:asparaginase domain-containing protein n=1 Tax=Oceaniserpentilla sp. 4NH20-0058 TaxID=3127660 RepID=UPI003109EE0F